MKCTICNREWTQLYEVPYSSPSLGPGWPAVSKKITCCTPCAKIIYEGGATIEASSELAETIRRNLVQATNRPWSWHAMTCEGGGFYIGPGSWCPTMVLR